MGAATLSKEIGFIIGAVLLVYLLAVRMLNRKAIKSIVAFGLGFGFLVLPFVASRLIRASNAGATVLWQFGRAPNHSPDYFPRVLAQYVGLPVLAFLATALARFLSFPAEVPMWAVALGLGDEVYERLARELRVKRDHLCAGLEAAGLEVLRPAGTYFANVDCGREGVAFCRELVERAGVVAIPTSVFYDDEEAGRSLVRFAFCKREEVIDEAAKRLATL